MKMVKFIQIAVAQRSLVSKLPMCFNLLKLESSRRGHWGVQGMHPPTRPKGVLTWHLISLKIIAKIFFTAHCLL